LAFDGIVNVNFAVLIVDRGVVDDAAVVTGGTACEPEQPASTTTTAAPAMNQSRDVISAAG
jgi:hypothetical protein